MIRMAETTLNLRGLKCPLPALRTRKALSGLKRGDILFVTSENAIRPRPYQAGYSAA